MDSLFFWIIVFAFLVPVALRLYRKSARRNQDPGLPGGFPDQPGGGYPGQLPGGHPGQNKGPRDGYTQQDYFRGGFGPVDGGRPVPSNQPYPDSPYPGQPYPDSPYPGQPGYQSPVPYEDSPEYPNRPAAAGQVPAGQQPGPGVPPQAPAGPQGYRARRLAELDQRYSNGELNLEDYMAQRAEIMKG